MDGGLFHYAISPPAVFYLLPSLICILLYPQIESSLLEYLASLSLLITSPIKVIMVSYSLWYTGSTVYNLVTIVKIHPSLKCRNMVLYILNLIPLLNLPWVVYPTIGSEPFLSWLLLHMLWYLVLLVYLPVNQSISWSYSYVSGNFLNGHIYSGKSFGFVISSFFLIFHYSLFVSSIGATLLILDLN